MHVYLIIIGILLLILFVIWMAEMVGPTDEWESALWDEMLWETIHHPKYPQVPVGQRIEEMHGDYTQLILKRQRGRQEGKEDNSEPMFCKCEKLTVLRKCKKHYREYLLNHARALQAEREKEKKMKLEAGKYYEVEGRGILECTVARISRNVADPAQQVYLLGDRLYTQDCAEGWPSRGGRILREVAPPLKLEVGALYETTAGVQRCSRRNPGSTFKPEFGFSLDGWFYNEKAEPCNPDGSAPKILYKLRVNEPVSTGDHETPYRNCTAKYVENIRAAMYMTPDPMPVRYKPHSDCTKREVQVPEGYEKISPWTSGPRSPEDLIADEVSGTWKPVPMFYDARAVFMIRPKPAPFKITGAGWYKCRNGAWVKDPDIVNRQFRGQQWWHENGYWRSDFYPCRLDLISRATPAQAAILDAL